MLSEAEKAITGFATTFIFFVTESLQAPLLLTMVIAYSPDLLKTFIAFIELEKVPSLKVQVTVDGIGLLVFFKNIGALSQTMSGMEKSALVEPIMIRFFLIKVSEHPVPFVTIKLKIGR